jgi:ATP-dependent RNA helicase DHX57
VDHLEQYGMSCRSHQRFFGISARPSLATNMVKKGKEKASAPAKAPAPAGGGAGGGGKKTPAKPPPEDDFIIFTNSTKDPKPKKGGPSAAAGVSETPADGPPKPTVKQIIGGASWTGKLPVNLLSEHCQKQKWERPDYDTRKFKEGYSVLVTLSSKNPKTGETTKLDPFKLPPSHVHLAYKPTALEARHFAATYALFRVCSMKNIHMMLPPDYRSLWKDFEALKKQDVKDGKGWMYEADPFTALREREEAKVTAEKKRKEQEAAKEKAASMPGAAGLVLRSNVATNSGRGFDPMRGWTNAPKIDMGNKSRTNIENLLRQGSGWNPHGVQMTPPAKSAAMKTLKELGFRESHIEEAVSECKDREESLEWLLIHVPEDDLPRWALPETYSAGVTVGSTDLRREGAIKRLSQSGYSVELCRKVFDESGADEGKAAEALQKILLGSGSKPDSPPKESDENTYWGSPEDCWKEETASLESVFGEHYSSPSPEVCEIRLQSVTNGPKTDVEAGVQFRRSPNYPSEIIVSVVATLPAYIKLSVVKRALAYAHDSLQGEDMKIYFIADWVQHNINDIIERPGPLRDIAAVSSAASEEKGITLKNRSRRAPRHPKPIRWTRDDRSRMEWLHRQETGEWKKMLGQRQKLPAWQVRNLVVETVEKHQVTIISGETGSGKSTQSVQFILDEMYSKGLGLAANIIVTQPRRISALGLADRVSEERCSQVGQEVGYTIRGENRTGPKTRITFVTTGILLRRLQVSGGRTEDVVASLADVSHVVLDEVHERSLDTDFLLTILKDVLRKRRDLKLVLMSATLDSSTFRDYFVRDGLSVGMVEIAGRTYPVEDFYADDIIRATGFGLENAPAGADPVAKAIQNLGQRINYSFLVDTAKAIDEELSDTKMTGGILVFLPGVAEINQVCNMLRSINSLHVLPLHAALETKEQRRVFASPPHGKRKVVVATNVAETSITIDDIVAVIDSGRVKETSFDAQNNMRRLEETWASLAACKQRRGRAGRVQAGKCYKLYTRAREEQMRERPDPEIRRVPLEQLCLSVRAMGITDVLSFLSRAPSPPEATAVEGAIALLRRMGALDGDELTALGTQLAMIPADLRCGKLMVLGAIFGCLEDCVALAAVLSTRSPFVSPAEKRDAAKEAKMRFARGDGDLLTDLRAVREWDALAADRTMRQREVRAWCDDNFLSHQTLSDIASTRTQYLAALAEIGIRPPSASATAAHQASPALLRAVTAAAFSPQICRIQFPDKKFLQSVSGAVELDPDARTIRYYAEAQGRVFVHPASTLFDAQGFSGRAAFLSYFTMMSTSKVFVRDLTREFPLLLGFLHPNILRR